MSELKAGVIRTPHNEGMTFDRGSSRIAATEDETEFYLKSEADEVIAELQKQVHDYAQGLYVTQAKAENEIRRQKCKRCLAMAERCKYRMYYLSAVIDYESSKLVPNPTAVKRHTKKESRMDYWKNRWLEFAEWFKEDK